MNTALSQHFRVLADVLCVDAVSGVETLFPFFDISSWVSIDLSEQGIVDGTEEEDGLFTFYASSVSLELRGDWRVGITIEGLGQCRLTYDSRVEIYRRCLISGTWEEARVMYGYIEADGISTRPRIGRFMKTTVNCCNFSAVLRICLLGKCSTYIDSDRPNRTFELFRRTDRRIPPEIPIPTKEDTETEEEYTTRLENMKRDVITYVEPDTYYAPGRLLPGDDAVLDRVNIFDSYTGTRRITEGPLYYRPISGGYNGVSIPGWRVWGTRGLPFVSLDQMLDDALEGVNTYLRLCGRNKWPTFLRSGSVPSLVVKRGAVAVSTGVWHVGMLLSGSAPLHRVLVFVWKDQWEVTVYELVNVVELTQIATYQFDNPPYSYLAYESGNTSNWSRLPNNLWSSVEVDRHAHPDLYASEHPDGSMFAFVGFKDPSASNIVYFGWFQSRRYVEREGTSQVFSWVSEIALHMKGLNTTSGDLFDVKETAAHIPVGIRINNNSEFTLGQDWRWEDNEKLLRAWGKKPLTDSNGRPSTPPPWILPPNNFGLFLGSPRFFCETSPDLNGRQGGREWLYFDQPWENLPPETVGTYQRMGEALIYSGDIFFDRLCYAFENARATDVIELISKLTNSVPVVEDRGPSNIAVGFRSRVSPPYPTSVYSVDPLSISDIRIKDENYASKEDIPEINFPLLTGLPESYRNKVDYYYYNDYFRLILGSVEIDIPMVGSHVPTWALALKVGDGLWVPEIPELLLVRKISRQGQTSTIVTDRLRDTERRISQ